MNPLRLALLLAVSPVAALGASPSTGHLDLYYTQASVDGRTDADGNGFGLRGAGLFMEQAIFYGEYQKNEYDLPGDPELSQLRAGLGYLFSKSETLELYGKAEYVHFDFGSTDDNGWAAHGGVAALPAPRLRLFGEVGYLDVADLNGPEYQLGGSYQFTGELSAIVSYRLSDLKGDTTELETGDLQLGLRYHF